MGKASRRKNEQGIENDYNRFVKRIVDIRKEVTTFSFTDWSSIHFNFFPFYEKILSLGTTTCKPSVTEYGGLVPTVSLYLASLGRIGKIIVVDKSHSGLQELEHVVREMKLPVDIVAEDIEKMQHYPDTDIGVSFNALYGSAQSLDDTMAKRYACIEAPVVSVSNHLKFAVFRYVPATTYWGEKEEAEEDLNSVFRSVDSFQEVKNLHYHGYYRQAGRIVTSPPQRSWFRLHTVIGWDRK